MKQKIGWAMTYIEPEMSHSLQVFRSFGPPSFFPMSPSICIQLLRGSAQTAEALSDTRGGRRWLACSVGGLGANNRCVTATSLRRPIGRSGGEAALAPRWPSGSTSAAAAVKPPAEK